MTAYRVVDDHKELDNIGTHTHEEIDVHIDLTEFVVLSGSGPVPQNARYLKAGAGIIIQDSGPGGSLTIISSGSGLTGPGGSTGQIQFNNRGAFGGTDGLVWNDTTSTLTGTIVTATSGFTGSLTRLADGSSYLRAGTSSAMDQTGSISITTGSSGQVTVSAYVFPKDLTVSLPGGKTFGRYESGSVIPATGKTPAEIILMAIEEPISPTVSLTSPTAVEFNQTSIENVLNFSHVINSLDATVSSAVLEWRRNDTGPWVTLISDPNISSCVHMLVDTNFNTSPFNYRYTVSDTLGATSTATLDIAPLPYVAPTISLIVASSSPGSIAGETSFKRETGNIGSNLSGKITRHSSHVPLTIYTVQFSVDSATWFDVPGLTAVPISGNPSSVNIPLTTHFDSLLKSYSSLHYRVVVTDTFQPNTGGNSTIIFLDVIFYGTSSTLPASSNDIRLLDGKLFVDGSNPFNLLTGTTHKDFTVAVPSSHSVTQVLDLDALNANITSRYVMSSLSVNDAGGTSKTYSVYTMSNAIPYTSNHRHQVTRS